MAVSVFVTVVADVKVTLQVPEPLAFRVMLLQAVLAPVTVTVPAGMPLAALTVKFIWTAWPDVEGSGEMDVINVVVGYRTL